MTTAAEVVAYAVKIGPGHPYVLGAIGPDAYDCSGFVYAVLKHFLIGGATLPREAGAQSRWLATHGTPITIRTAFNTPGAILSIDKGPSGVGAGGNHIAFVRSPGFTIEARSRAYGIGTWPTSTHRWTRAALIPGVNYSTPVEDDDMMPCVIPAAAEPDGDGRFPFYRLDRVGTSWRVRGYNGAAFQPGPGSVSPTEVALPAGLVAPPVGMAEHARFIVVVAEDGGTFAYAMSGP